MRRLRAWIIGVALFAACSDDDTTGPPPDTSECPPATPVVIDDDLLARSGFPEFVQPANNKLTEEGVALGRMLFYDPILSGDSSLACSGCHLQQHAFGDTRRFSEGIDGLKGTRQAPTIVNPAWILPDMFWDGRAQGLEEQATEPVPNPIEMHLPWPDAIERLERHPDYPDHFCAAFGTKEITRERVVKAIAQFQRTFISLNSRYDQWRRGEIAFTPAEERGFQLFMAESKGDCFHCHDQTLFATSTFHNTGLDSIVLDAGRSLVTGNPADFGKFKSMTLRNIAESFPYMHDGRFFTLHQVIDHYNMGFHYLPHNGNLDPLISKRLNRVPMTAGEIDTLVIFLESLTDFEFLSNPDLASPFAGPAATLARPRTRAR